MAASSNAEQNTQADNINNLLLSLDCSCQKDYNRCQKCRLDLVYSEHTANRQTLLEKHEREMKEVDEVYTDKLISALIYPEEINEEDEEQKNKIADLLRNDNIRPSKGLINKIQNNTISSMLNVVNSSKKESLQKIQTSNYDDETNIDSNVSEADPADDKELTTQEDSNQEINKNNDRDEDQENIEDSKDDQTTKTMEDYVESVFNNPVMSYNILTGTAKKRYPCDQDSTGLETLNEAYKTISDIFNFDILSNLYSGKSTNLLKDKSSNKRGKSRRPIKRPQLISSDISSDLAELEDITDLDDH